MATSPAITGERMAGTMTFSTRVSPLTAPVPMAAMAAPTTPPTRAWLELEGSESAQVTRFQAIAPMRAAKTIVRVSALASTIPVAMVVATLIERKAPIRFMSAATPTAMRGRNAPLAIDVAIALAVSWKPLVKSNASAKSENERPSA